MVSRWVSIAGTDLWLGGLALVLAVISYGSYSNRLLNLSLRDTWRVTLYAPWTRLGAILFCAGMGLSAGTLVEQVGWGLLVLYGGFKWWGARNTIRQADVLQAANCSQVAAKERQAGTPSGPGVSLRKCTAWVIRREVLWLTLLVPLISLPYPAPLIVLIAIPLLWVARRITRGYFVPPTPFDWAILLMMLAALVSASTVSALFGYSMSMTGLLLGIGLYYAVVDWETTGSHIVEATAAFVLAGVILSGFVLLSTEWIDKLPLLGRDAIGLREMLPRIPGLTDRLNPNLVGGALTWEVPFQVAIVGWSLAFDGESRRTWAIRVGLALALILSTVALLLTQSRSALMGVAVSIAGLFWPVVPRARWLLVGVALLSSAGIAVGGVETLQNKLPDSLVHSLSRTFSPTTLAGRVQIWQRALYAIEDFPLTGVGTGAFQEVVARVYPVPPNENTEYIPHAHNQWLQAAVDLGLPGLLAYMAIWILSAAQLLRCYRIFRTSRWRWLVMGAGASLLAYFIFGLTDVIPLSDPFALLFWSLIAILVILGREATRQLEETSVNSYLLSDEERAPHPNVR